MRFPLSFQGTLCRLACLFLPLSVLLSHSLFGSNLYWDSSGLGTAQGGSGAWDSGSLNWTINPSGGSPVIWPNGSPSISGAIFGGLAGTATIAPGTTINANSLIFRTTGYTIAGTDGTSLLNLDGTAPTISTASGVSATISALLTGGNLTKTGTGTLTLSNADTLTGLGIMTGSVTIDALNGSLNNTAILTFGNATLYGGTGTFNYNNTTAAATRTQSLGALAFNSGDGAVQSTRTAAQTVGLTFSSLAARGAGATRTFVASGGTNGTNNSIAISSQATGFIDYGTFFSTGTSATTGFAFYDAAGFVRGINYTTDTGAATIGAATTLPTTGVGGGPALYVQNTGAISAQDTQTLETLHMTGTGGVTQTAGTTLTVNGLLKTGGNAATITGGTLNSASSNLVIYTGSADVLTISSTISNSTNGLVKSGAGTLRLTKTNSYTGTTYLNAGIIDNGSTSVSGILGTGQLIINGGTIVQTANSGTVTLTLTNSSQIWAGDFSIGNGGGGSTTLNLGTAGFAITLTGDRVVTTSGNAGVGSALNINGIIGDGGNGYNLTWAGNGSNRVRLGNTASTYSGVTTVLGGNIQFSGNVLSGTNSSFGNATSDILLGATSGAAAAAILNDSGTANFSRNITVQSGGTGSVTIGTLVGDQTTNGSINMSGNITLGTGTTGRNVTLRRGNFSGNIVDPAGLVSSPGVVTITSGTAANGNGENSFSTTLSGNNTFSGGLVFTNGGANTVTLILNSATAIGTGTFTISGTPGTVALSSTAASPLTLTTNNAQVWNRDFSFTGTQALNMGTGAVSLGTSAAAVRTVTTTGANPLTIGGAISDGTNVTTPPISLTKAGVGTLILAGANTYTGITTISAGTLQLGDGGATGSLATSSVVDNGTLAFNRGDAGLNLGAVISGTGGVTQLGTGKTTLNVANTYLGVTTISAGTLSTSLLADGDSASGIGQSSNAAANLVLNGGALQYTGAAVSSNRQFTLGTNGGTLDASGTGAVNFTSAAAVTLAGTNTARTLTLTGTNTGANTLAAAIGNNGSGATSVTKSGGGVWILSAASSYTGATTVNAGTLVISGTGSINSSSGVGITGGNFRYDSSTALDRNVTLNGGAFSYNSAANYTGTLTHTSGKIGGTNWNGNLNGLSIGAGKTISPGNSIGNAATASQSWLGGGAFDFEINDANGALGVNWDHLTVTGTLNTTGLTSGSPFVVNLISLDGSNAAGLAQDFDPLQNYSWEIVGAGSLSPPGGGFTSNLFTVNTSSFQNPYSGTFSIVQNGNALNLAYTAIPEPSAFLVIISYAVLLGFTRRRSAKSRA